MNLKKIIYAATLCVFAAGAANAQLFVTGNFSMDHSGGETVYTSGATTVTTDKDSYNTVEFGFEGGYAFSDNFEAGLELAGSFSKQKSAENKDNWYASNMFYINPFARYNFVTANSVKFGAKAMGSLGFGKEKTNEADQYKNSEIGIHLIPVLDYEFNSNWSAFVSFGDLYFTHSNRKIALSQSQLDDGDAYENKTNHLGVDLTWRSLTFGVKYTF